MTDQIDIVYTWCSSSDSVWNAKRRAAAEKCSSAGLGNAECRFADNDELRFSLRSVEKFAPWFRRVFLVVDDDISLPGWLNDRADGLTVVRLSEIMEPWMLPCFSSDSIEHRLARIRGLSEKFVYSNDDCFFNRATSPDFFFASDGYPYFRFGAKRRRSWYDANNAEYVSMLGNADELLMRRYGGSSAATKVIGRLPHHNMDAYRRSDLLAAYDEFAKEIEKGFATPFRDDTKVQRVVYAGYSLAVGHGHFRRATFNTSSRRTLLRRLLPSRADTLQIKSGEWKRGPELLAIFNPNLFCFNDAVGVDGSDHEFLRRYLGERFPGKSRYEKETD